MFGFLFQSKWRWRVTATSPYENGDAAVDTNDTVVASVGNSAVMEKEIINCVPQDFVSFLVVFHDWLVRRVRAGHNKRCVDYAVEEHVMQPCIGKHDTNIVQMGGNQSREIV